MCFCRVKDYDFSQSSLYESRWQRQVKGRQKQHSPTRLYHTNIYKHTIVVTVTVDFDYTFGCILPVHLIKQWKSTWNISGNETHWGGKVKPSSVVIIHTFIRTRNIQPVCEFSYFLPHPVIYIASLAAAFPTLQYWGLVSGNERCQVLFRESVNVIPA